MTAAFSPIDLSVLVVYVGASVSLGFYHARRQGSLDDYFLAERSVPWWAAGISIIASDTSAITYIGAPAYIFRNDLQLALGFLLTFPLMMMLVARLFVPFMARLRLFTSGPLLGVFLLGVLSVRANSLGVLLGAALGTAAVVAAAATGVSYFLYGPVGCAATMATGWPLSFCFAPQPAEKVLPLTVWATETTNS